MVLITIGTTGDFEDGKKKVVVVLGRTGRLFFVTWIFLVSGCQISFCCVYLIGVDLRELTF